MDALSSWEFSIIALLLLLAFAAQSGCPSAPFAFSLNTWPCCTITSLLD